MKFEVAIVGGGPAGAACATFCAMKGLRVLLLEREKFPREKVCGDCINPGCWPILQLLQVDRALRQLAYASLEAVEFIDRKNRRLRIVLPEDDASEIAVKRSIFDYLLLERARETGAEIHEKETVTAIARSGEEWELTTNGANHYRSRILVAADGRNSTVARLLGLLPRAARDRVGLQAHVPLPGDFGRRAVLQFLPGGYSGQAPVNKHELNLCLVGRVATLPALREWARSTFKLSQDQPWRTITPLTRRKIFSDRPDLFLIGDAARVVEPFTGEGIFYALKTGEISAEMIARRCGGASADEVQRQFRKAQAAIYRGRFWVNELARIAVTSPRTGSLFFQLARFHPELLGLLTHKIVRHTESRRR